MVSISDCKRSRETEGKLRFGKGLGGSHDMISPLTARRFKMAFSRGCPDSVWLWQAVSVHPAHLMPSLCSVFRRWCPSWISW